MLWDPESCKAPPHTHFWGNPRRSPVPAHLSFPREEPQLPGSETALPFSPGGAAGGRGAGGAHPCVVPACAHPSLHMTGGNNSRAGAPSVPNPGYFKPGEWEMLATEAQSSGFAARGLGRALRGTGVTWQCGSALPSLGGGCATAYPDIPVCSPSEFTPFPLQPNFSCSLETALLRP